MNRMSPAKDSKIPTQMAPERRVKRYIPAHGMELLPVQQGQARLTSSVMAAGLLGWLAHAVGVWLQHR